MHQSPATNPPLEEETSSPKYSLRVKKSKLYTSNRPIRKVSANVSYKDTYDDLDMPSLPKKPKRVSRISGRGPSSDRLAVRGKATVHPKISHPIHIKKKKSLKVETPDQNLTENTMTTANSNSDAEDNLPLAELAKRSPAADAGDKDNSNASTNESTSKQKMEFVSKTVGLVKRKRKRNFNCTKCEACFPLQGELNSHYRDNHEPVKCPHCVTQFSTPCTLTRHLYMHEIPTKKCPCGEVFRFNSELKAHKLTHHWLPTHHCAHAGCDRSYFNAADLTKHVKTHKNMIWCCSKCKYTTKDKWLLKSHQRKHEHEHRYTCQKCGKGFIYHTQWARHKTDDSCS